MPWEAFFCADSSIGICQKALGFLHFKVEQLTVFGKYLAKNSLLW